MIFSLSAVGLSAAAAVVCYDRLNDEGLVGICTPLLISGDMLTQGEVLRIAEGELEDGPEIAATRLSETAALVCCRGHDGSERAACSVVSLSGRALVRGSSVFVSLGHFHSLVLSGLSADTAVVCYRDFGVRPAHTACALLQLAGGSPAVASRLELSTGRPLLAQLTARAALACSVDPHSAHAASCSVLTTDVVLAQGPELSLGSGGQHALAGLSPGSALLCYEDTGRPRRGVCRTLTLASPA